MSTPNLLRAGLVGVVAGLAGAALAIVMLFWPEHSAPGLFRYPFTTIEFLVFQVSFFVQHVGLAVPLGALALSGAARGLVFRVGAWLAVAGMAVFSLTELAAMGFADADALSTGVVGTMYGLASVTTGLGLIGAGVAVARAHRWSGWRRWTPLATGAAVFVVVLPGLFGGFVLARLVIAVWMLLFAALGWSLITESRNATSDRRSARAEPVGGTPG